MGGAPFRLVHPSGHSVWALKWVHAKQQSATNHNRVVQPVEYQIATAGPSHPIEAAVEVDAVLHAAAAAAASSLRKLFIGYCFDQ